MRISLFAATLGGALWLSAPASAADDYVDCANAMTQLDMNICANKDYLAADRKLNAAYRRLRGTLDSGGAIKLRDAQRAWIVFRDKECRFESAQNEGGSIYPMVYAGCATGATDARTRALERLLKEMR